MTETNKGRHKNVLPDYKPFPVEALPSVMRRLVEEGASALGCDPAFVALPALAVTASTIGMKRTIQLKRTWREPASIWSAVVCESGTLKTPAHRLAVGPLFKIQQQRLAAYRTAKLAFEEAKSQYEEKRKVADKNDLEPGDPPPEPKLQRVYCSDTTIEKLAEVLEDNPNGVLVSREELAAWFRGFTRYKSNGGTDLPNWLELSQAGTLSIDRKTGERRLVLVPHALASVTGGIQPGVLTRCLTPEFMDSGLAARLLLAYPPKKLKQWTDLEIHPETERNYEALLTHLLALKSGSDDNGEPIPVAVQLSPEAKAAWVKFYNWWAGKQWAASGELAAAYSKLEAYAARFALIHHVASRVSSELGDRDPIQVESIAAGTKLCCWFAGECQRIYQLLAESEEERETRHLIELIKSREGHITVRDLQRSNSRKYPTSDAAQDALQALVECRTGEWQVSAPRSRGGHRPETFVLLPAFDTSDTRSDLEPPELSNSSDNRPDTRQKGGWFRWDSEQVSEVSTVGQEKWPRPSVNGQHKEPTDNQEHYEREPGEEG